MRTVKGIMRSGSCLFSSALLWLPTVAVDALGCASEVVKVVSTPAEAEELAVALACNGSAQINVEWRGRVKLTTTLALSNGDSLHITGSDGAIMDGGGELRLLTLSGATLNMHNISLENGWATDVGGAIAAYGSSLTFNNCSFSGNSAAASGGEYDGRSSCCCKLRSPSPEN